MLFQKIWQRFTSSGAAALQPTTITKQFNDTLNIATEEALAKTPLPPKDGLPSLPEDDALRADFPLADGLLDYFPNALAEVAKISKLAGDKHHPGEPLHWERGKSVDHRNKIVRHVIDSGKLDSNGNRHSGALAWRALALLQEELEAEYGYPQPRNAK